MLFRRRNVPFRSVCQFNVHRNGQRTADLQFDSGNAEDLVRNRGDSKVSDSNRLQLEFRSWVLVQSQLLKGIHFRPTPRQPIADLRRQFLGPLQTRLIRYSPVQLQCRFFHRQ